MKSNAKWFIAAGGVAVAASLVVAGVALANPSFGHRGGPFGLVALDMLSSIDANADRALTQDEINAAVEARYTTFDSNKDGQLSLDEFQALWVDLTRPVTVRAFQFLDSNGDAALARAEADKRFGTLVAHFDHNADGKLSSADRPPGGRGHHGWHRWGDDDRQQ
jgi:hypothetical protein